MYAIIKTGGKQYRVEEGLDLQIEKLTDKAEGEQVQFQEVLMTRDDQGAQFGRPFLSDATVKGEVLEHGKGDKITVYKYKKRKGYRKKQGHRQPYTAIRINSIEQN